MKHKSRKQRYISALLACAVMLPSGVCAAPFSDVDADAAYAPYVDMLTQCKVLSGRGNSAFDPNAPVTRAELAKMAVIMTDGAPSGGSSLFGDISSSHWAAQYVNTAAYKGFITGYTDGTFRPEKNLTYAEAVTVALRMLDYTSADLTGGYPYAYINKAREIGLTDGLSLAPDDIISRADAAYIFGRAFVTDKKGAGPLLSDMGYSLSDECTVLSSYGVAENEINTTVGTYTYDGDKTAYIGNRAKLVIDGGRAAAVLPVRQSREGGIIVGLSGSTVSYFDGGEIKTVQLAPSSNVYFEGAQAAFSAIRQSISVGDLFYYSRTSGGGFDYGVVEENDNIVPTFGADSVVYGSYTVKNSKLCYTSDINLYDAVYYYPNQNLSLVYSSSVSGVLQSAYPTKSNAATITVSGTEYSVDTIEAQEAVSRLTINDTVSVALGRNGGAAAVYKTDIAANVYGIERVIGDNIVCVADGATQTVKADDTWRIIFKGKDTTFGAVRSSIGSNMQMSIYYDGNGSFDYAVIEDLKLSDAAVAAADATVPFDDVKYVIRDGKSAAVSDIRKNDVLYFNSITKTVYAYCDSISGIYEKAYPDAQNPSSVQISGKIYDIETVGASYAFSSLAYESGVTVLLGKDGAVAAVADASDATAAYGVITNCTEKTVDGKKDYYVTCIGTGGEQEFKVKNDKSDLIGKSTMYKFEDGYLSIGTIKNKTVYGDIDKLNRKIGTERLSSDCVIADVAYVPENGAAIARRVELSDIARSSLSVSDITAVGKADDGLVHFIALNNVTRLDSRIGIATHSRSGGDSYKIDVDGAEHEYTADINVTYGVGAPVIFNLYNGKLVDLTVMQSICQGSFSSINGQYLMLENGAYDMAKNCVVYIKTDTYEYKLTDISEIDEDKIEYAYGYSEVSAQRGGMLRAVVLTLKK